MRTIDLFINYRSDSAIVDLANRIIAQSPIDYGRPQEPARAVPSPDAITIRHYGSQQMAVEIIAREIGLNTALTPPGDVAILGRTHAVIEPFAEALVSYRVPIAMRQAEWKADIWSRPDAKRLLRVLRLVTNPHDMLAALAIYAGKIGPDGVDRARSYRTANDCNWIEAIRSVDPSLCGWWGELGQNGNSKDSLKLIEAFQALSNHRHELDGVFTPGSEEALGQWMDEQRIEWYTATVADLLDWVSSKHVEVASQDEVRNDAVNCLTAHACVVPGTIVETSSGLRPIESVAVGEMVGTPSGLQRVDEVIRRPSSEVRTFELDGGYELTATKDHRLFLWDGHGFSERRAREAEVGDWMRVRISANEPTIEPILPRARSGDVREMKYRIPKSMSTNLSEFLGLMVADGTVFKTGKGFRLTKKYKSVVARFAALVRKLFGYHATVSLPGRNKCDWICNVNSVFLTRWLVDVGGMKAHAKDVPTCIMGSRSRFHAAFLRGLFEDGTVNERRNGRIDHVAFTTKFRYLGNKVQQMLARLGIASRRFPSQRMWRVDITGEWIEPFRYKIGFISPEKNDRLAKWTKGRSGTQLPLDRDLVKRMGKPPRGKKRWAYQNALFQGHLTRTNAATLGIDFGEWLPLRITSIKEWKSSSHCLTVRGGRFLQNGIDAGNSKGLEFPVVYVVGCTDTLFPHKRSHKDPEAIEEERRLLYTGVTRAMDRLHLVWWDQEQGYGGKQIDTEKSRFLEGVI